MLVERGQTDPVSLVIGITVVAIMALLGIFIFSQLNQTVTISGSLAGTGEQLLEEAAEALAMAVGGTSIAIAVILILRAKS